MSGIRRFLPHGLMEESRMGGYVRHEIADELLKALTELLAAGLAPYPSYEDGKEAQDAWSDRRAAARNNAQAVIDKATGAARSNS